MKMLRNREKICRLTAALLCLCMVVSAFAGISAPRLARADENVGAISGGKSSGGVTGGNVQRQADPSTMDDYKNVLNFETNTRYAGRLWTDKSVFAYSTNAQEIATNAGDRGANWNGKELTLTETSDGIIGEKKVALDSDFLHVYSVLGSSQELTGVPPVRTVIVFDNSGSMYNSTSNGNWAAQRIAMTVEAIDRAIDSLMEASQYNEVSVVLFGDGTNNNGDSSVTHGYHGHSTAVTILPMKHYTPNRTAGINEEKGDEGYTPYITGGWNNSSEGTDIGGLATQTGKAQSGGWVFVDNDVCKLSSEYKDDASNTKQPWYKKNDLTNGWNDCEKKQYTSYQNGTTNIQAGLYQGMQELLQAEKTKMIGSETYKCVPSLVLLSDGAVTDTVNSWLSPDMENSMGFVNDFSTKGASFTGHNDSRSNKDSTVVGWNQFLAVNGKEGKTLYKDSLADEESYELIASKDAKDNKLSYELYNYINKDNSAASVSTQAEGNSLTAMKALADQYAENEAYMVLSYLLTAGYYKQVVKHAYNMDEDDNWSIYTITVDMADPSASNFSAGFLSGTAKDAEGNFTQINQTQITTNPAMMNPKVGFNVDWLEKVKYLNKDVTGDEGKTFYDDYTVGDETIKGILKAIQEWENWNKNAETKVGIDSYRAIRDGYNFKGNSIKNKIETYTNYNYKNNSLTYTSAELKNEGFKNHAEGNTTNVFPGPDHSNFFRVYATQEIGKQFDIPTKADAQAAAKAAGFELEDLDYNYVDTAYYAYTANGSAADLTNVFVEIMEKIMKPLFQPVGGGNDLGVSDAVTYMDPMGQYMDVKDVEGLLLFGEYYDITETATYNYEFNDTYMSTHNLGASTKSFTSGWYLGDNPETAIYGSYQVLGHDEGDRVPDSTIAEKEYNSAEEAWEDGWEYRLSTDDAQRFVPTLERKNQLSQITEKQKKTKYKFYRIHIKSDDESGRRQLRMNPAYGDKVPSNVKYDDENPEYQKVPGVYALDDLRIWVEDSGDYVDPSISGNAIESDASYDEALYINIPVNMLPLRTVTIDLGKTGTEDSTWTYTANLDKTSSAYKASFPLRVFYTVGLSDDIREDNHTVNLAKVSTEYLDQNRASSTNWAAADGRNMPIGYVEFLSNWYNPTARYTQYANTNTDYSFGDPVMTFSPADDNRYYIFEKALPLYNAAYVWVPEDKLDDETPVEDNGDLTDRELSDSLGYHGLWKRLSIQENYTGTESVYIVDPTSYRGGDLFAQDVDLHQDTAGLKNAGRQKAIWDALGEAPYNYTYEDVKDKEGEILLLKNRRLTTDNVTYQAPPEDDPKKDVDPFSSEKYFFMAVEYYALSENDGVKTAKMKKHVVVRKGSEFGSAYAAQGINNGDMLCWYDVSGEYTQIYPYLSRTTYGDDTRGYNYIGYDDIFKADGSLKSIEVDLAGQKATADTIREAGEWVVSARPGGLRVGNMAQNVSSKSGSYTNYNSAYIKERFPNAQNLTWGFYAGNVTRTANNYLLPSISVNSSVDEGDKDRSVVVNVYLGNNGRLLVPDAMLSVTKQFTPPADTDASATNAEEDFLYQLYVKGVTGTKTATQIFYNPYSKTWQRRVAYIDVLTDNQDLLLKKDGSRAVFVTPDDPQLISSETVIEDGNTVTKYYGADEKGERVDYKEADVFYLYVPDNGSGDAANNRRIYQDKDYEDANYDTKNDFTNNKLTIYGEELGGFDYDFAQTVNFELSTTERPAGTFAYSAANAELIPVSGVTDGWTYKDYKGDPYPAGDYPIILSLPDSSTSASNVNFLFQTKSVYMTQEITFGMKADGETSLTENDIFDQIIPTGDREDLFGGLTNGNGDIAANTAEFTLKNGEGLLLTGLDNRVAYRFTEKMTEKQLAAGYTLKEVVHVQQVGSRSIYRPGLQQVPVYSYDGATYGKSAPESYENEKPEYGLTWAVDQEGNKNKEEYLHYEPFDHTNAVMWEYYATMEAGAAGGNHHQPKGAAQEESTFFLQNEDKGIPTTAMDNPLCKPLENGGCDVAIKDSEGNVVSYLHYMYKDGQLLDAHYEGESSAYLRRMSRGLVSPTVHFGMFGETQGYADSAMPARQDLLMNNGYNGVYSVFGNTGYFEEQAHFSNTVLPRKTETEINGDKVGPVDRQLVETDPSDPTAQPPVVTNPSGPVEFPGVDEGDKITYRVYWRNDEKIPATVTIVDELDPGVTYDKGSAKVFVWDDGQGKMIEKPENDDGWAVKTEDGSISGKNIKVTFVLDEQPADAQGYVELTVTVNENAKLVYDYKPGSDGMTAGEGTDYKVLNRAHVEVGSRAYYTNIVENPVDEKTEIDPGDGEMVDVGELITYQIRWKNDDNNTAYVTVQDTLDPGVDFVSAEWNETVGAEEKAHVLLAAEEYADKENPGSYNSKDKTTDSDKKTTVPVIRYDGGARTVTWKIGEQDAGEEGFVTLIVRVNEQAKDKYTYGDTLDPNEKDAAGNLLPDTLLPGEAGATDYEVLDRARVTVGNVSHFTNIVENPLKEKTEVSPGDGEGVQENDEIVYEIRWENNNLSASWIEVLDKLDPGVDLISAWIGDKSMENRDTDDDGNPVVKLTFTANKEQTQTEHAGAAQLQKPADGGGTENVWPIEYTVKRTEGKTTEHSLTWNIHSETPGEFGFVSLRVRVNAQAKDKHTYNGSDDGYGMTGEEGATDYEVLDQARITVENKAHTTNTVENPVDEKTEIDPGDGNGVEIGDLITYQIRWKNGEAEKAWVSVSDTLDPGVDFVSAAWDEVIEENKTEPHNLLAAEKDANGNIPASDTGEDKKPGADGETLVPVISYGGDGDIGTRTVTWNIGTVDAGKEGVVTLTVRVNEKAKDKYTYDPERNANEKDEQGNLLPDELVPGKTEAEGETQYETDYEVIDRARITVGNESHFTDQVENPVDVKTEIDPGDGVGVKVGQEIVYEIRWQNKQVRPTWVKVFDELDPGVDLVSAWIGGKDLENEVTDKDGNPVVKLTFTADGKETQTQTEGSVTDPDKTKTVPQIEYTVKRNTEGKTTEHSLTWNIYSVNPGEYGIVSLRVRVNAQAKDKYTYNKDALGNDAGGMTGAENETDYEVLDRAQITVGNNAHYTDIVENPVDEKTEVTPGDGKSVGIGDRIEYNIHWKNDTAQEAYVVVTDTLDEGVDFAAAEWTPDPAKPSEKFTLAAEKNADGTFKNVQTAETTQGKDNAAEQVPRIRYDAATRTVFWTIGKQKANAEGDVRLTVSVNEKAKVEYTYPDPKDIDKDKVTAEDYLMPGFGVDYMVYDRAKIKVDNEEHYTNIVENPVDEKRELTPGAGVPVTPEITYKDENGVEHKIEASTITYEIRWENDTAKKARVIIVDELDPGVDYMKDGAAFLLSQSGETTIADAKIDEMTAEGSVTYTVDGEEYTVTWSGHSVVFDLGEREPNTEGVVRLSVKVNEKAAAENHYKENGDGTESSGGNDYKVLDRAKITVGNKAHHTNIVENPLQEKIEVTPGDGVGVEVGEKITYNIRWKNDKAQAAYIVVTDTLDRGVDFASASYGGVTLEGEGSQTGGNTTISYAGAAQTVPTLPDNGGTTTTAERTVVWNLGMQEPGAEGVVTLTVVVNDQARLLEEYVATNPAEPDTMRGDAAQTDDKVVDRAKVFVDNEPHFTNEVENPLTEKKELTPGAGVPVTPEITVEDSEGITHTIKATEITYEIRWANDKDESAEIVVTDKLDKGVDFVSASFNGVTLNAGEAPARGEGAVISYDAGGHAVTWNLGSRRPGAHGVVTLTVRVNDQAKLTWDYDDQSGTGNDYKVVDRAEITVGNEAHYTNKVENPVHEKHEVTPGDGMPVGIGDPIRYMIDWEGQPDAEAYVVVTDTLDPGVDFEDAPYVTVTYGDTQKSVKGVFHEQAFTLEYKTAGGESAQVECAPRTVVWDIGVVEAGASGRVELLVKVNADAKTLNEYVETDPAKPDTLQSGAPKEDMKVVDRAKVVVENTPHFTSIVENPLKEKTEVDPGEGETVNVGKEITYNIRWKNDTATPATVVIVDELDPGVDFVSAEWGDIKLPAKVADDGKVLDSHTEDTVTVGETKPYTIQYENPSQTNGNTVSTVTWNLGEQEPGAEGAVALTVRVNKNAKTTYTYNDGEDGMTQGAGEDYQVLDRAKVAIGENTHYTNIVANPLDEKREVTPGDGVGVSVGEAISYEIDWEGRTDRDSYVIVMDTLDPGVDYVTSTSGGRYFGKLEDPEALHKFTDKAGVEHDVPQHTVVWDIGEVATGARGTVTLSVQVNDRAKEYWEYTQTDPNASDALTKDENNADRTDYRVVDRAKVIVDNEAHFTNEVVNPVNEKQEVTPGPGETVDYDDEIVYEITWRNDKKETAYVIVEDPIDPGLDFVKAWIGKAQDEAAAGDRYVTPEKTSAGEINGPDGKTKVSEIAYAMNEGTGIGTVTWNIGPQAPGAEGVVSLRVRVNRKANVTYYYEDGSKVPVGGTGADNRVVDRAEITVGDEGHYTNVVENPLDEKSELTPGAGVPVSPEITVKDANGVEHTIKGDVINYRILWQNDTDADARILIADELDPGVDYVPDTARAYVKDGEAYKETAAQITYEPKAGTVGDTEFTYAARSVLFDLGNRPAHSEGCVELAVRVNKDAKLEYTYEDGKDGATEGEGNDYRVLDRAKVSVGGSAHYTNIVENPLNEKIEVSPGEGENVNFGDEITYNIRWKNDKDVPAYVVVTDTLDPGVDFVRADNGTSTDLPNSSDNTSVYYETAPDSISTGLNGETAQIAPRTVVWYLGERAPHAEGVVTLTVKVNDRAKLLYEYTETHPSMPDNMKPGAQGETDFRIVDRAKVIVDNEPHFTNEVQNPVKEKRELTPGEGENVKVGDLITYEIEWSNGNDYDEWISVADTLDPGVTFVSAKLGAASDANAPTLEFNENGELPQTAGGTVDKPNNGGSVSQLEYSVDEDGFGTVTWNPGIVKAHEKGVVTLTVRVNEKADIAYFYEDGTRAPVAGTGTDNRVVDRAEITVGNSVHYTNEVENPLNEKTEVTPGDGEGVKVGEEITYEIEWKNGKGEDAWVSVSDTLDPGVTFVSAKLGAANEGGTLLAFNPNAELPQTAGGPVEKPDGSSVSQIEYSVDEDGFGVVTWNLGTVNAGAQGVVTLTVVVNENASKTYYYEDGTRAPVAGEGADNRVVDRAEITVGNDTHVTNEVENPVREKTEVTPGDGEGVKIGDEIVYEIAWKNGEAGNAWVSVSDTLDPGVTFVSAKLGAADESGTALTFNPSGALPQTAGSEVKTPAGETVHQLEYSVDEDGFGSVTWNLGTVSAGAQGVVTLTVRVNDKASVAYYYEDGTKAPVAGEGADNRVVDRAEITVGNSTHVTNEVENPVKEKTEVTPGDGEGVKPGDKITYEIAWAARTDRESYVVVMDTLDPGVKFEEATESGVYTDVEKTFSYTVGGVNYTEVLPAHSVVWDLGLKEAGATGKVRVTVTVKSDGEAQKDYYYAEEDPLKPDRMQGGDAKDNVVINRAKIIVDHTAHFTNEVENPLGGPDKTETLIDRPPVYNSNGDPSPISLLALTTPEEDGDITVTEGDLVHKPDTEDTYTGPLVFPGDRITYEISWQNYSGKDAAIVITDPLDENVKFISASFDWRDTLDSEGNPYAEKPEKSAVASSLTPAMTDSYKPEGDDKPASAASDDMVNVPGEDGKPVENPVIQYAYNTYEEKAEVLWNLGVQPAGSSGKVKLVVQVLPGATEVGYVENTAYVAVGNDEQQTRTVENPTPSWQKEEKPYDEDNEENLPYEGDQVQAGQRIHYEIEWYNNEDDAQAVIIVDPLDKGVDFTRAWYGDRLNPYVELTAEDVAKVTDEDATVESEPRTLTENGFTYTVTISYDKKNREVKWTLSAQTDHYMPKNSGGVVDLDVTVNEKALNKWVYAEENGDLIEVDDEEKDHQVVNRAKIHVGDVNNKPHYTTVVENPVPEKTEIDPGADKMVSVGQTVAYSIHWENRYEKPSRVIITDPLDKGADFLSAGVGELTLAAGQTEILGKDDSGEISIAYDPLTRTVVWTLEDRPAGSEGDVELKITVNELAAETWAYEPDQDAGKSGEGYDFEIVNRARVQVGDHAAFTNEVENPVPDKQEKTPGEGKLVNVGDDITYEIYWKNGHDEPAEVTIEDTLDPGLTFKSASDGGTYDEKTRTVTWTLPEQPAKAQGHVTLTVTVNGNALVQGGVENTADVQIGRDPKARTRVIPNPTGPAKAETLVNGADVSDKLEPAKDGFSGPYVKTGDIVAYRVRWINDAEEAGRPARATISVKDPLDKGVDFVSASFGGVTLRSGQTTATGEDEDGAITIAYDASTHTVTWTLENRAPASMGIVTLEVRVNTRAPGYWQYGEGDTPIVDDPGTDNEIVDRAAVKVGNGPWTYTNVMRNPLVTPAVPMTGDESKPGLWTLLALLSAGMMAFAAASGKRSRAKKAS